MRTTKAKPGQTVLDIALQTCGDASAAAQIAVLNGLTLTDALVAGTEIQVPEWPANPVRAFFHANGISSATLATSSPWLQESKRRGIGSWAIGVDFIIS